MSPRPDPGISVRPAVPGDLPRCAEIWRLGLDGYSQRVGRLPMAPPAQSFHDLMAHLLRTDGATFLVAERPSAGVVAFVSAVQRGRVWYLSMLFVVPSEQGRGLGRRLLEAVLPAPDRQLALSTATDSVQPISNALYSRFGIMPRMPILELAGRPVRPVPGLPAGVRAVPFDVLTLGGPLDATTSPGTARLAAALDAVDTTVLGYTRPVDHAFLTRTDRRAYLYETAAGEVAGYGYIAASGRIGPIAVLDETLMGPVLGHLLGAVEPRGAYAAWVPGANTAAIQLLLDAGLAYEDFPALLCWTTPYADFARYLPITLALL